MIHETCEIHTDDIHETAKVWNRSQIMSNVSVGEGTSIGRDVFIGKSTKIGRFCKIQNAGQIFGAIIGDHVLIGPRVVLIEDPWPRAFDICISDVNNENSQFNTAPVKIEDESSVGAGAIIAPGITIGRRSMVAAGSVVLKDVPENTLVAGNPARPIGEVCKCGRRKSLCEKPDIK